MPNENSKVQTAFLVLGFSCILLNAAILIISGTTLLANLNSRPVHYDMQVGDHVSWNMYDQFSYGSSGDLIDYKNLVMDSQVVKMNTTGDLTDLVLETDVINGTENAQVIINPVEIVIILTSIILISNVSSMGGNFLTVPGIAEINSSIINALQDVLDNFTNNIMPTTENISALHDYITFLYLGILPSTFNYTILDNYLELLNKQFSIQTAIPDSVQITNNDEELGIFMNASVCKALNINDFLVTIGIFRDFQSPLVDTSFRITWDKNVNILNESLITLNYTRDDVIQEMGMKLIRTTMEDSYPNTIPNIAPSRSSIESINSQLLGLKIMNISCLIGVICLIVSFLFVYRKSRR